MEEEIAKTLSALEQDSSGDVQSNLRLTFVAAADEVEYTMSNDEVSKYILVRIPYRSLAFYNRISSNILEHLEEKFNWPVIVVANRKIQSKRGKSIPLTSNLTRQNNFILTWYSINREDSRHPEETKNQNSQGCSPGFPQ